LAAIGDHNIVHRDLKPSNIRVRPNGHPIIVDFGLARFLDKPDLTATADGGRIGTPLYFAPEQFTGSRRDIDCRTDLFAVGVLMHQTATGAHPFYRPGMTYAELQDATCTSEAYRASAPFTALPRDWQLLIARLLEKQRVKRPKDAAQFKLLLARLGDKS
jgi:serine/threonine-protein kinase